MTESELGGGALTSDYVMAATGYDGNEYYLDHIEIINVKNMTSCPNLPAPYPMTVDAAVSLTFNGSLVICAGLEKRDTIYYHPSECNAFNHVTNNWELQPFGFPEGLYGANTVEYRPGEWIIIGGLDGNGNYLSSTTIFKDGILTPGPELPEASYRGSAVMLNPNQLFVAIGKNAISTFRRNYIYDFTTGSWFKTADRINPETQGHNSGVFWNATANEHQIATFSVYGIEIYTPSHDLWFWSPKLQFQETGVYIGPPQFKMDTTRFI